MKQQDFFDLTAEMEKACGDWENSEGLSESALKELKKKVEILEAEENGKVPEKRKVFRLRKRYLCLLAAAMALLLGMGAMGDRVWIAENKDLTRADEVTTKINNEEKESVLLEEDEVYKEVAEQLGIAPVWFGYMPEGMTLDSYEIMEGTGWASVYYLYDGNLVSVQMTKKSEETSSNLQLDGSYRKLEGIENIYGYGEMIEAYCVDEENKNFAAGIAYGNGYYKISGFFEENEFLEILNEIYFKNL